MVQTLKRGRVHRVDDLESDAKDGTDRQRPAGRDPGGGGVALAIFRDVNQLVVLAPEIVKPRDVDLVDLLGRGRLRFQPLKQSGIVRRGRDQGQRHFAAGLDLLRAISARRRGAIELDRQAIAAPGKAITFEKDSVVH